LILVDGGSTVWSGRNANRTADRRAAAFPRPDIDNVRRFHRVHMFQLVYFFGLSEAAHFQGFMPCGACIGQATRPQRAGLPVKHVP
jgi:hypothetical protein